jgi:hypothetical protein
MQHFVVPICYFPSMVLFLDNGHDFLLNIMLQLNEHVAYRLFDSPIEAIDFIKNNKLELETISRHCMSEYTEAKRFLNQCIDVNLAALHAEVYNPYRFSELSVLVVDYKARTMDGLEFCRRVESSSVKKLLLINPEDEVLVIKALNEGLIDGYIYKQDKNIVELINQKISSFQLDYFLNMSNRVARILSVNFSDCLYDLKFAELFNRVCEKNKIVEYYLIEASGSFLMLDEDANLSVFMVKHERDIRTYYDYARSQGASDMLLECLARGEKIPGILPFTAGDFTWTDWLEALVPSERFFGTDTYVYAYIPNHSKLALRHRKILSYHRYLDELDAEELSVS